MKTYKVHGSVSIGVTMTVEAETQEEAMEKAYEQFHGLTNFAGNGGTDQLVGVYDTSCSLDAGYGEPEFNEVEESA